MDSSTKNYICRLKAIAQPFTFRCEVEQFPLRLVKVNDEFESPEFKVGVAGVPLQIGLKHKQTEELAVYLRSTPKIKSVKLDFSVTVVNSQPEKSVKKHVSEGRIIDADPWYWAIYIPYAEVVDKNGGFLKDGHQLTVLVEGVAFDWKQDIDVPLDVALYKETCEDFGKLFDDGSSSDFVVKAKDADGKEREFKVHRHILAARSKVFAAMFSQPELKECREGQMLVEDIDSRAMEALLRFLYSGKIPPSMESPGGDKGNNHRVLALLVAADKYGIMGLKNRLERILAAKLSVENVCECFVVAGRHSAPFLATRCREFVRERVREVVKTDGWTQLCTSENAKFIGTIISDEVVECDKGNSDLFLFLITLLLIIIIGLLIYSFR